MRVRVLITGCGGFVGGHLAKHLLAETDWSLWGTRYPASRAAGSDQSDQRVPAGVAPIDLDLRDPDATAIAFEQHRPDLVFHLAALSFVPAAWREPWATIEANVLMQLNVLRAAEAASGRGSTVRIVVASTNEVYGGPPSDELPTSEAAALAPANPYATSKAAQDLLAGQYARSPGLDVVIIRPFTHVGPGQDDRFVASSFARQVAEAEAGLREPRVRVGNLEARRDFSDVRDIVRGYRLAAQHAAGGAVYNLGSGRSHPVRAVLEHFTARSRVPIQVLTDPDRLRPSDVPETLCDATLAGRELGWRPAIPFEQTLDDILADWRGRVADRVGAADGAGGVVGAAEPDAAEPDTNATTQGTTPERKDESTR